MDSTTATINLEDPSQIKSKINELKAKACIPAKLPDDFLRISLNQQQINESQDNLFARQLQYNHDTTTVSRLSVPYSRGRLNLTIIEAKLAKSYSMLARMDPYVRITLGDKVFETDSDYGGGKTPKWNKTISCYLSKNVDSFLMQIFDEKSFSSDEVIAVLNYTFPDELLQGIPVDEWLPLSGKLGEQKEGNIHLRLEFIPLEHLRVKQPPTVPLQRFFNQSQLVSQQMPAHESPDYSDDDVKTLKEMFPNFDEEILKSLLEANNGDKESTINQLLQMS